MSELFERLREERERLKLNQEDFGILGGVTKRTQAYYESGERTPDANYLASISRHGVDVQFVITGKRSVSITGGESLERASSDAPPPHLRARGGELMPAYAGAGVTHIDFMDGTRMSREDVCSMVIDILHAKQRTLPSTTVWAIVDSIMALQRGGVSVDKSTIDTQLRLVK